MKHLILGRHYKWYAVASFVIVGWVAAFVVPPYNHMAGVSLPIWRALALIITLVVSSLIVCLAIKNTKHIVGRCALVLLLSLYAFLLVGAIREFL